MQQVLRELQQNIFGIQQKVKVETYQVNMIKYYGKAKVLQLVMKINVHIHAEAVNTLDYQYTAAESMEKQAIIMKAILLLDTQI